MRNNSIKGRVNGVTFNGKHSYYDYGMFFSQRPQINAPEPKLITVDIPGSDGMLDLTESVTGAVTYDNRLCEFFFVAEVDIDEQARFKTEILNDLHGKNVEFILDEDAEFVYNGRATVSFVEITPKKIKLEVMVDAYPYKRERGSVDIVPKLPRYGDGRLWPNAFVDLTPQPQFAPQNTYFLLRDNGKPYADLSLFQTLTIAWETRNGPNGMFYIKDATGAVYSQALTRDDGTVTINLGTIQTGTIQNGRADITKIYKITINNIPDCSVTLFVAQAVKTIVPNGKEPVIPYIYNGTAHGIWIYNQNSLVKITEAGWSYNENFILSPGDNEVVIKYVVIDDAVSAEDSIIRFVRGEL